MTDYPNLEGRIVAMDTETTGLSFIKDRVFAVAIAVRNESGRMDSYYYDLRNDNHLRWAKQAFKSVKIWVNHAIKFDAHMCRESGIQYDVNKLNCTMIREALIDENKYEYGLDALGKIYLGATKVDIWPELAQMFGGSPTKAAQAPNLSRAPTSMVGPYAVKDAEMALEIWEKQEAIIEQDDLRRVHDLEHRLLPVILDMERRGVKVDIPRAEQSREELSALIIDYQNQLDSIAGYAVNVNSSPQIKKLCGVRQQEDGEWYAADGLRLEKTDGGGASLDSVKLQQCKVPGSQLIVDIRGLIKARDVFLNTYILKMNHQGYVHASMNQTRTEDGNGIYTGRISISEPALQQIHKRNKKMAAIIRACFIPDSDASWLCYDWAQMDFRIFAQFLNDPRINEMYRKDANTDFHSLVSKLTGLPRDRDQKTGGGNSKQINLACVFGMGPGELAKQCGLPYTQHPTKHYLVPGPEAKDIFAKYHDNIPGVRKLQNKVESVAKSRGYIMTQTGRRIRFPGGKAAHKAAGLLYQSTAADAMKVKMVEVYDYFQSRGGGRLMLTVHDEFDISIEEPHNETTLFDIKNILQRFDGSNTPMVFRIPIKADMGLGDNWWEASK